MLASILTLDHRRLENLVEEFMKSPNESTYNEIRNAYVNHIYWEEEFLFPKINNTTLLTIMRALEVEHGSMWMLLDKVKEYLEGGKVEEAQEKISEFMRVLLEHDGAEEGSVYQELDQLSDEEQAELILEEIKIAVPPKEWKCKAIR
ncbi:hemerythrin domain-containing protein [Acidianus sp. HS-5]|uniref:hemerythrin domain-containing protein n=1 Tax=Acidianus sp. HS-5 TaxID=2886040 RepID=UPI001F3A7DE0|nr:hemerythrin domain-containing protein [Acidianus sp. HS-5]BDC17591.1 hemerythrin [Acidianus sp. HS-5]